VIDSPFFLILRRMRAPLILLISAYAIATLGLTLMPGVDATGKPAHLSFFHAFYIISYTATTIGFGEVPHPFSNAQRAWTVFSIYLTVIPWFFGIGKVIELVQDGAFRQMLTASRFARKVGRIRELFYLICGYGESGSLLVDALEARNQQSVVVDADPDRINDLVLHNYHLDVPALTADASHPDVLTKAGLLHPHCAGIIALSSDDQVNLAVAVAAKLLRPNLKVLARVQTQDTAINMASFGTDHIINPFELFGEYLAMAIYAPSHHLLYEWLTGVPDTPLVLPLHPPRGHWIVCGYGRFGKAVVRNLGGEGIFITIIEADPEKTGCENCVVGRGTEAETLRHAGIEDAVGIVAGTDNDVNNLSIVMTAREIRPQLFVAIRQNKQVNGGLFQSFAADVTMQPPNIIAHEFLALVTTPSLAQFLTLARQQDNQWANELISRLSAVVGDTVPELWDVNVSQDVTPGLHEVMRSGGLVRLIDLMRDPENRELTLPCMPLLLRRRGEFQLLPEDELVLRDGDCLLFCGNTGSRRHQMSVWLNFNAMQYIVTGRDAPGGSIWKWWENRLKRKSATAI
jgi:voltage-gated potassium channel